MGQPICTNGKLIITNATLDLSTIWPAGDSDGDTLRINVTGAQWEFRLPSGHTLNASFYRDKNAEVKTTTGAHQCVTEKKATATKPKQFFVTVRLQGVDCPELKYSPSGSGIRFRQHYGEEAAQNLRDALDAFDQNGLVTVRLETRIDLPQEPFDVYGRFISDVYATGGPPNQTELCVNLWLLENGWAFPCYYDSMDAEEIKKLDEAWRKAWQLERNIWDGCYQHRIPTCCPDMVFRKVKGPDPTAELALPKIFRRQLQWWMESHVRFEAPSLADFLRRGNDFAFLTKDFLRYGRSAVEYNVAEFISAGESVLFDPEALVFRELDCTLSVDGQKVTSWSAPKACTLSIPLPQTVPPKEQKNWVNSVAVSEDGSRIAAATFLHKFAKSLYGKQEMVKGDYALVVYDAQGGVIHRKDFLKSWDGIFSVAISGDRNVVAGGGAYGKAPHKEPDTPVGLLYAYDVAHGAMLLEKLDLSTQVGSVSLSRDGSILAAAATDRVLVYRRAGNSYVALNPPPGRNLNLQGEVNDYNPVAVHPGGEWLVACDTKGNVLMVTLAGGAIADIKLWTAAQRRADHSKPDSPLVPAPFLSIAIAAHDDSFCVGGGDYVYWFTKAGFLQPQPEPFATLDTWNGDAPRGRPRRNQEANQTVTTWRAAQNVRWVALSPDGQFLAVVANRRIRSQGTGLLLAYHRGSSEPAWYLRLPRNPNGVSVGACAAGIRIAVADGYPVGKPGAFLLFDGDGRELWHCPTPDMNWPVAISKNGTLMAGGCDDGKVYLFDAAALA